MTVSVIVCTRNRAKELFSFIESLSSQTHQADELVIIDSSDNPLNLDEDFKMNISKYFSNISIVSTKPGLTYQRNIGIKNAKGELLFFFDDDIVLKEDYLEKILAVFSKDESYFGGMGQIETHEFRSLKGYLMHALNLFFRLPSKFGNGIFYDTGFAKIPHGTKSFLNVEFLSGGVACYRKIIFDEFYFDENFNGYGFMEDADFSYRVSRKYRLFYEPNAKCIHNHVPGGRGNDYELYTMLMKNYRYVFLKNFYTSGKLFLKLKHYWSVLGLFVITLFFGRDIIKIKGLYRGLRTRINR